MAGSARFGVTVDGFDEAIARLSALPKEANRSVRAASKRIAADEAIAIYQEGTAMGGVFALAAESVRARSDRIPSIQGGGPQYVRTADRPVKLTKRGKVRKHRAATRRTTAGQIFFGAEFGGGARPETQQFAPHKGREGYFFFPTLRADSGDIGRQWGEALDEISGDWGRGG